MRFACEADRASSSTLELAIHHGSCAAPGELVFTATLSRGEEVPTPSALRDGAYSFHAQAMDGTRVVTGGCVDLTLPSGTKVETLLDATHADCAPPEPADGGEPALQFDGGDTPRDAATQDSSASADAGTGTDADSDSGTSRDANLDAQTLDGSSDSASSDAAKEASVDVGPPSCSCSGCGAPCACADTSCFSSRLFITYSGDTNATWRPTATLTVQASAVVRLGFVASEPTGAKLVAPPEPLLALMASSFSGAAEIDAFATLPDGRYLFSTRDDETFLGEPFDDDDLIAFEPLNQSVSRFMDLGSLLGPVSGSDVDVDALHVLDDNTIYFSVDADVKAGNATFGRADLLRLGTDGIERVVNGADAFGGRDLESLALNPASGNFLASFAGSGGLSGGASFTASDLVELGFGPGEPTKSGYTLFLKGSSEFSAAAGTLSAVHFGE